MTNKSYKRIRYTIILALTIAAVMLVAGCYPAYDNSPKNIEVQDKLPVKNAECVKDLGCPEIQCFKAPCPENKCINGVCTIVQA